MRKRITRGGRLSFLLGITLAFAGCFSPDLGPAECVACDMNDKYCPGELVCQQGFCVLPGSNVSCHSSGAGGEAGQAGEPSEPSNGGQPETAGSPSVGGAAGVVAAGEGGAGSFGSQGGAAGGTNDLAIDVSAAAHACTMRNFGSAWSVNGGTAPYQWTLVQAPAGFTLKSEGNTASVEGVPSAPGEHIVTLKVTDATGSSNQSQLLVNVRPTPILQPRSLPSVCPNEVYSVDFAADGSTAGSLTWSVDPEFVAATGLDFEGDRLGGRFTGGTEPGVFELEVTAMDGDCISDPQTLSLTALGESHGDCPTIAHLNYGLLPRPCAGQPYEEQLIVEDGSGNYSVEAIALPDRLGFDDITLRFDGVAESLGTATFRVADENGHTIEQSFELEPRHSCWLAYLSDETGESRLHLFDPELESRHLVPAGASEGPVLDFAFSPDGRVLAFRSAMSANVSRVQLLEMSKLQLQSLHFESASSYVWSDDSSTLAVAYDTPNGRYLGGAKVASPALSGTLTVTELVPVQAAADQPLAWFAGKHVGFLTHLRTGWAELRVVTRTADGFSDPNLFEADRHEQQAQLRGGQEGLFVVPPSNYQLVYYNADGWDSSAHAQIPRDRRAMAPSGLYLVRLRDGLLELVAAEGRSGDADPIPDEKVAGCDAILAWASGQERIACATADDGGRVAIFDVNTATDSFEARELVLGSYTLEAGAHTQRWRAFSKSGNRFAFTTDEWLYVATLDDGTMRVQSPFPQGLDDGTPEDESVYSELAFSPDEQHLLVHRGTKLEIFDVDTDSIRNRNIRSGLRTSVRCEEDFVSRIGPYCGAELPDAPYAWSGDSSWLVFQEELGTLKVLGFRPNEPFQPSTVGQPCAETCPGGSAFAFQP